MLQPKYKRVVLKLSGEALAGPAGYGIDAAVIHSTASQIKEIVELGTEVGIIVGGGNIWRGVAGSSQGMDRATADYMGMLATVLNALALQDALENKGVQTRVQTSIEMRTVPTICQSIRDCFAPAGMTPCPGFADTANFVTGIQIGKWERRSWIPPTTPSRSIPCWNTMMFPRSST